MSTIYPGKYFWVKVNLNNQIQKDEQSNIEKNEIEKLSNKIKSFKTKFSSRRRKKIGTFKRNYRRNESFIGLDKSLSNLWPETKAKI